MLSVISVENVSKTFGELAPPTIALKDVTFSMCDKEFVSLIGPSGCGKTTLLRIIANFTEPTSGKISVQGKSPRQARLDRDMSVVFQDPVLLPWRTVTENVRLPGEVFGNNEIKKRAEELIRLVGLEGFEDALPRQLSGGMQTRVALARALSVRPSLLLMDEPFGRLDEITRHKMQFELLSIWQQSRTAVFFITHHIAEAVFLSDRVLVMTNRPGRIKCEREITFPRPRDPELHRNVRFVELVENLRRELEE